MFAGHFGLAAGIKAADSGISAEPGASTAARHSGAPLWALMLSTQLLDVGFAVLVGLGRESYGGSTAYGQGWIHAYYTHSLVGALLIAMGAGALAWTVWGRRGGMVIAATVFSHWLLDLLVHRPDLPILPGNAGNLPMLGFGLWNYPVVSIILEAALVVGGATLYFASVLRRSSGTTARQEGARGRAMVAGIVMTALLALSLITSVLGIA